MSADDLHFLYKLHKIDYELHQIKQRAGRLSLDPKLVSQRETLLQDVKSLIQNSKSLELEYKDLELNQKSALERKQHLEKELYQPAIMAREVSAYQKEIKNIEEQSELNEARMLELLELIPLAKEKAEHAQIPLKTIESELKSQQILVLKEKEKLQAEFKHYQQVRKEAEVHIPAALKKEYETLLIRGQGIAMTEITPKNQCQMCGTQLAERLIQACKEGKKVQCESCRRILYTAMLENV